MFASISPKLDGQALLKAEKSVRRKRESAHKSISILTSYLHGVISQYENDEDFINSRANVQEEITLNNYKVDQRALESFTMLLFCSKKVCTVYAMTTYAVAFSVYCLPFSHISFQSNFSVL